MAPLFAPSSSPPPAGIAGQEQQSRRPAKRPAPRFLGDGDDDDIDLGQPSPPRRSAVDASSFKKIKASKERDNRIGKKGRTAATTTEDDIDQLFADIERDDGEAEGGVTTTTSTTLLNDKIDAFGTKKGDGADGEDGDGKVKKARRQPAYMNEARLMSDRGLKKLRENLKGFKVKGKGHEEDDLRRLMTVYQLWTHQMFPKGTFRDTLVKVEKLCRSRSATALLREWRDEARGIFKAPPTSSDAENHFDDAGDDANVHEHETGAPVPSTSRPASPAGTEASRPAVPKKSYFDNIPTSSPGGGLGYDPEMQPDGDDEDHDGVGGDDERIRREGDDDIFFGGGSHGGRAHVSSNTSELGFNDADLTFDLDNINDEDEDEDMAALMDMEREAESRTAAKTLTPPPGARNARQSTLPQQQQGDDDNFDDFDFPDDDELAGEFEEATRKEEQRYKSKADAKTSFYTSTSAAAAKTSKSTMLHQSKGGSTSTATAATTTTHAVRDATSIADDNFDDFDFEAEEQALREMEDAEAAAMAKTTSLATSASTGSASTSLISDRSTSAEGEDEDEAFLRSIEEGESADAATVIAGVSVPKSPEAVVKVVPSMDFEEEDDMYS